MIMDKSLELDLANAVTVSAASANIVDTGAAGDAIGSEPYFEVRVATAATAAGAATVNFQLQTATDAAFTTPIVLFDSGAIGKAALTANSIAVRAKLPVGAKQFIRAYYVVSTGPLTAGSFDVIVTPTVDTHSGQFPG